jgi:hypothetical protein
MAQGIVADDLKSRIWSLSTREERAGREMERGVSNQFAAPPLPDPLLRFAEERE